MAYRCILQCPIALEEAREMLVFQRMMGDSLFKAAASIIGFSAPATLGGGLQPPGAELSRNARKESWVRIFIFLEKMP